MEKITYTRNINESCGDLFSVNEFREICETGGLIDYDGFGHPVRGNKENVDIWIQPSELDRIPADASHIMWYNK